MRRYNIIAAILGIMLGFACFGYSTVLGQSVAPVSSAEQAPLKPLPNVTTPSTPKSDITTITTTSSKPPKAPVPDGFAIKMTGGRATPNKAKEGVIVTVQAAAPAGMEFDYWASNSDLDFKDKTALTTSFTMPGHAIVVTAHYKEITPASYSSKVIVANSYVATFKIDDANPGVKRNADKTVTASTAVLTTIDRNDRVTGKITEANVSECIEFANKYLKENNQTSSLKVEVKLPVADEYSRLTVKLEKEAFAKIAGENVSQFTIATKAGAIQFDKAAINALKTQIQHDFNIILIQHDKNMSTDRIGYEIDLTYENADGVIAFPATGVKLTIPFEIANEKNNNKITIMGVSAEGFPLKIPGASYNAKLKAAIVPVGVYKSFNIGL